MKTTKIISIIVILFLTSCRKEIISTACPNYIKYTLEEQKEVDRARKQVNNITLDKFLIDYGNLREDLKICNEL